MSEQQDSIRERLLRLQAEVAEYAEDAHHVPMSEQIAMKDPKFRERLLRLRVEEAERFRLSQGSIIVPEDEVKADVAVNRVLVQSELDQLIEARCAELAQKELRYGFLAIMNQTYHNSVVSYPMIYSDLFWDDPVI